MKYHPKIIEQIAAMAAQYAVVYLDGQPYPLTAAGDAGDGRLFYMEGQKPHFLPEGMRVEQETNSVAFYRGKAIAFHFTPVAECYEIPRGHTISMIEMHRKGLGAQGIAATIRQLDPDVL